jgi:pimeloyl-ACP methyl ester carboxylesterase
MKITSIPARWRSLVGKSLFIVLGLCTVSASAEHILEVRDAARLTANDTFYSTHGRRIRYHLTGQQNPGPTVVLLNGLTASLEQWDAVQTSLSTTSPVLSYDRGGSGFSDPADGYGAIADADELEQLLHSPELKGPFVLVSYSSSSMMATVFTARHPDLAKGIVFVEPAPLGLPSLPAPGKKSYRRVFWRFNLVTIYSFFGYTRLRLDMEETAPPSTPTAERYDAALKSWHHWLASTHDAMNLDSSARDADSALAAHPFAHVPLGVLVTFDPSESPWIHQIFERDKKLAASSDQGVMRVAAGNHDQLLKDPVVPGSTVDLIRSVVDEARAKTALGVASGAR